MAPVSPRTFSEYHDGFDKHIYDDTGQRYSDLYPVTIDSVSMAGDLMTVAVQWRSYDHPRTARLLLRMGYEALHRWLART